MGITKKQHYIPRRLLKFFTYDKKEHLYEFILKSHKFFPKTVYDTMCQNYVYEHPFLELNTLENSFAKMESLIIPHIETLLSEIENSEYLTSEIKKHIVDCLPLFLFFYYRSGALLIEYSAHMENPEFERVSKMLSKILDTKYINRLAKTILNCYKCCVVKNDDFGFLLSDQYISTAALSFKAPFSNASNRNIGMIDTPILIPLSAQYYIVFYHGNAPAYFIENKIVTLNEDETDKINSVIAQNSYVKCVARDKKFLSNYNSESYCSSPSRGMITMESGLTKCFNNKKEVYFYKSEEDFSKMFITHFVHYKEAKHSGIGRNDPCPCKSGKKYKKCCFTNHKRANDIYLKFSNDSTVYAIPGALEVEMSIEDFSGSKEEMSNPFDKMISDKIQINKS